MLKVHSHDSESFVTVHAQNALIPIQTNTAS